MKKFKKSLAVLLAVLMLASMMPMFASAADSVALTEANVTVWPTANGSIYFGQKLSDGITLSGGEVQYDGAVVAGHFELIDPEYRPKNSGQNTTALKFVPDDTTVYTGFEMATCYDVITNVERTTPVFVDENDTVPVATEVEPGAKLSTSTLSGAKVKNPYYEEEPKALAGVWKWAKGSTVINESGYYEARITIAGYERLTAQVYVKVKENMTNTTIAEAPTVGELTYDANRTWADVELTGGKAVEEGTETEVAGTFTITKVGNSSNLNKIVNDGDTVEVTFTPDDTDKYISSTTTITVTVNPAPIKFLDDNGNEIVPEITVPYGTKIDNGNFVPKYIKSIKTNYDGNLRYILDESIDDTVPAVGTHEYTIKLSTYKTIGVTPNYLDSTLTFKLIVEPVTVEMEADWVIVTEEELAQNERYYRFVRADGESVTPKGTYDVYVDGELIADDVKTFKWLPTASKTYEFRVIYNPIENDPFTVNEWTQTVSVSMLRKIRYETGTNIRSPFEASAGAEVKVYWSGANEDFESWVITDSQGNPVELDVKTEKYITDENGNITGKEIVDGDYTSTNIIFTMPDHDITITTKDSAPEAGSDDDSLWGFWQKFVDWLVSIYRLIMDILVPSFETF